MAKIIRKGHQLENEIDQIKAERQHEKIQAKSFFLKTFWISLVLATIAVIVGLCVHRFVLFLPIALYIVIGGLFIGGIVSLCAQFSGGTRETILSSGVEGERIAAQILSCLPEEYTVYQDATVFYDGKSSELDNIVIGRTGIFVIETKNHNSRVTGCYEDRYWDQTKIGRGGTEYGKEFYSPVKQVGTHIYRLANYLRNHGLNTYVKGIVLFTNSDADVYITGSGEVPVFSTGRQEEKSLLDYILSGNEQMDEFSIQKACSLIGKT